MKREPEYKLFYSGWPKDVVQLLNISIGIFLTYYKEVKIGITCDPKRRFKEHLDDSRFAWERMVVKYQTNSIENANKVEDYFIDKRWDDLTNIWTGKSWMSESGPYYAYILLGRKRRIRKTKK